MVLMVRFLSCAHVSVHLKNPDFSYFGAYIPHFCVFVIGDIYRVKREYLRENLRSSHVIYFTSQAFSIVMHFTRLVIVFTMQEFLDRTIVLTAEQTFYGGLSVGGGVCEGGVWCSVVRGVCCWGCGVCEGRYPSDAL